jgi:hypothetical protein
MNEETEHRAGTSVQKKQIRRRGFLHRAAYMLGLAFFILALAIVVMAGWAAYVNVGKFGWGSDAAAAWVQAAGSIAAIVGAAWLARNDARRARRLRRQRNEEAAWYVRFAINQAQFESHIIAAELVHRTTPMDKSNVREWLQRAKTSTAALNAFVERTDHIHPAVTQVTSNAKVLMDDLVADLVKLDGFVQGGKNIDDELIG